MSVVDQIKNIFTKKATESEMDSRLSLATPDGGAYSAGSETVQVDNSPRAEQRTSMGGLTESKRHDNAETIGLPLLGQRTVEQHQRMLSGMLAASLLVLAGVTFWALNQSDKAAQQLGATGQALMQSQRLAKSVSQALVGSAQAFNDVAESSGVLARTTRGLKAGDDELRLSPLDADRYAHEMEKVMPLVDRAEVKAKAVLGQQKVLTQIGTALRLINRQSSDMLEIAEAISALKVQQNAPATEIAAVGQLVMLTQRIGKSSNEFLTAEGVSPEAVFLLGKDLNTFKEIAEGLQKGSSDLKLSAVKDAATKEQLAALVEMFEQTRVQAGAILGNLQGLVSAREAQGAIVGDSESLRRNLEELQSELASQTGIGTGSLLALALAATLARAGPPCAGELLGHGGVGQVRAL